jgi:hypothetical protein
MSIMPMRRLRYTSRYGPKLMVMGIPGPARRLHIRARLPVQITFIL